MASIRSSGASQSTIKLVATNLIANGKLSEGIQLLCLIDKGLDACRYLQTYGQWHQAAWLAKVRKENECSGANVFLGQHLLAFFGHRNVAPLCHFNENTPLFQATLDYTECSEVMKRWADHLSSPQVNQKVVLTKCRSSSVVKLQIWRISFAKKWFWDSDSVKSLLFLSCRVWPF